MTDEAYDAQTLATSHRIERLHQIRFGPQRRTWTCEWGHVNRERVTNLCSEWGCMRPRPWNKAHQGDGLRRSFPLYALSDPEELIYSRAN